MTEEQKHYHIKEIAEDYVSKSWNTFLDLEEIDLVLAGIGVGKIIADEYEKRIMELEQELAESKDKQICTGNCASADMAEQKKQRILELEQRITELEKKYSYSNKAWNELVEEWKKDYNDLEKKNAELKLKLEALEGETPWKDIKDKSEVIGQLTKAKEIIRKLMLEVKSYEEINDYDTCEPVQEAEQFLKDSEVEK